MKVAFKKYISMNYANYIFFVALSVSIGLTRKYNFLLFHSIIEIISIAVATAIFFIFWNSKEAIDNNYFVFIGTAFLFISIIDLIHTLAYSGMNIFTNYSADLATQLWIAARFFQAFVLLFGFLFIKRKIKSAITFLVFLGLTAISLTLIFTESTIPLFIEGEGLTLTKKISEYIISAMLVGSSVLLYVYRENFDKTIFRLTLIAFIFMAISEMSFAFYLDVYGVMNMVGHFFKLFSIYFLYRAFIAEGVSRPINLLFKNLQDTQFQRMQSLIENQPDGVIFLDEENNILLMNPAAEKILPRITNETEQKNVLQMDNEPIEHYFGPTDAGIPYHTISIESPEKKIYEVHGMKMKDNSGTLFHILNIRDVTIETQIRLRVASQERLAALGEMARGITHDFQNIVNTIAGASELAEAMSDDAELINMIELIRKQSFKGSELITQILSFSRDATMSPIIIPLEPLIENTMKLIQTALPQNIKLHLNLKELDVEFTKIQLEQILMNLVMNARDAMPKGGNITISTDEVDHSKVRDFEESKIKEGTYTRIKVLDDGEGMSSETASRVFEPFFTTKPVGKGSGLGMSQVYGITRQHEGYICIQSEVGKGTEINLFFPKR